MKELEESLGEGLKSFTIESGKRIKLTVTTYGATLLSVKSRLGDLPAESEAQKNESEDKEEKKKGSDSGEDDSDEEMEKDAEPEVKYEELTLCRDNLADLKNRQLNPYYGATVGRVAGRISKAAFTIKGEKIRKERDNNSSGYGDDYGDDYNSEKDSEEEGRKEESGECETYPDKTVQLAANDGQNCIHGGVKGFDQHVWEAKIYMDEKVKLSKFCDLSNNQSDVEFRGVKFTRTSPDQEEGFPGTLELASWYLISEDDKMLTVWEANLIVPEDDKESGEGE